MRILVSDQSFGDGAELERRLAEESGSGQLSVVGGGFEFEDVVVHEGWRGPGTVELRPNAQAPIHLLPVLDVEAAFHWRVDFTLVYGRVLEELG
jgi:acetoacetate decarboxylase